MEGPFYVLNAPDRQVADGKAVLATSELLKESVPFILTIRILSPSGKPLARAKVDIWQANTEGLYYYASYTLRGRCTTNEKGEVDILTVPPGAYGPAGGVRAGHFHVMVWDEEGQFDCLTTQIYVCQGNNEDGMNTDFLNYVRARRTDNLLRCWSVPSASGERYNEFPAPPTQDLETSAKVEWWNAELARREIVKDGAPLKIVAGGTTEIKLNEKPGWLGF